MKLEIEVLGTTPPPPPPRMKIVQDFFLYFWAGQEFSDKSAPPPLPHFQKQYYVPVTLKLTCNMI